MFHLQQKKLGTGYYLQHWVLDGLSWNVTGYGIWMSLSTSISGFTASFYSLMVLWIQNQAGDITELYGHALNKSLFLFGMWYVSPPGSTVS